MTEAENLQRSLQADFELRLTADSYASIRADLGERARTADSPEKAWEFILEARALDRVMKKLVDHIHTAKFDQQGKAK